MTTPGLRVRGWVLFVLAPLALGIGLASVPLAASIRAAQILALLLIVYGLASGWLRVRAAALRLGMRIARAIRLRRLAYSSFRSEMR